MKNVIGIRRESADATERRAPLTPDHVARLLQTHDLRVIVQPSRVRIFNEEDYLAAGAVIQDDVSGCNVVFGLKEIPVNQIRQGQVHCFFSHTIKAQRYNMSMLRHLIDAGCTLMDYELVTNEIGKRLIFAGDFAGYAGMIDALWALGRRLESEGVATPFSLLKQAIGYGTLAEAEEAIRNVGGQIRSEGLPGCITPFVCAFTGRGNVSKAAQKIFGLLPSVSIEPDDLPTLKSSGAYSSNAVYGVEFRKSDLYEPIDGESRFDPAEFDAKPGSYRDKFQRYIEYLTVIVNGVFWSPRYPRLLSREHMRELYARLPEPQLKVVADITCDIEGSIEFTVRHTTSENPAYVFEPVTSRVVTGFVGNGPVVLAVDKLPAELPIEASDSFGNALLPFVPALARADFTRPFEALDIPRQFTKAVIVHQGRLTTNFRFLNEYLL